MLSCLAATLPSGVTQRQQTQPGHWPPLPANSLCALSLTQPIAGLLCCLPLSCRFGFVSTSISYEHLEHQSLIEMTRCKLQTYIPVVCRCVLLSSCLAALQESINIWWINEALANLGLSPIPVGPCNPVSEAVFNFVLAWAGLFLPVILTDGPSQKVEKKVGAAVVSKQHDTQHSVH